MASDSPEISRLLEMHDFRELQIRMNNVKTQEDMPEGRRICGELDAISEKLADFQKKNGHSDTAESIKKTVDSASDAFTTRIARTIVITRLL
jgi:hypothetical protein